jgi:hypothetical protein
MKDCNVDIIDVVRFLEDKLLDAKQAKQTDVQGSLTGCLEILADDFDLRKCVDCRRYQYRVDLIPQFGPFSDCLCSICDQAAEREAKFKRELSAEISKDQ